MIYLIVAGVLTILNLVFAAIEPHKLDSLPAIV